MKTKNILVLVFVAYLIKTWLFSPFIIPSSSMDTSLIMGDYVIVNKWQSTLGFDFSTSATNKVLAFHYPLDKSKLKDKPVYIKRCLGAPGDSLVIINGTADIDSNNTLQHDFIIKDPEQVLNWKLLSKLGIHLGGKTNLGNWLLPLNKLQIAALKEQSSSLQFSIKTQTNNHFDLSTFPSDTLFRWNNDFYGPIYIPKKGDTINLSEKNIALYKRIIEVYEENDFEYTNSNVLINGVASNKYQFKQNYYFMLGDNRHHSKDSRHWGFVPQNHLVGSCSSILFNIDNFSFNRMFKSVN